MGVLWPRRGRDYFQNCHVKTVENRVISLRMITICKMWMGVPENEEALWNFGGSPVRDPGLDPWSWLLADRWQVGFDAP